MTILNSAISGLLASQRSLSTVSHNISNVNTEGFSRQRVDLSAREAQLRGAGYVGTGVRANSVTRIADQFLISQLRSSTASAADASSFLALSQRVDNMLANAETGLSPSLQNFFAALQDVNDLPSSATARQVLISEANSLTSRFQFIDSRLSDLGNEVTIQLNDDVSELNTISRSIAEVNEDIVAATGAGGGSLPNDLLDQRDQLILELSQLVTVTTVEQSDGALNVFIGKGQPVVVGNRSSTLAVSETYEGNYDILISDQTSTTVITESIAGGSLGGQLDFQQQMLEPAKNALGRLAIGIAHSFNEQHRLGLSLDGDVDTTFFSEIEASVIALGTAPNNVTADIVDPNLLTDSDYRLTYNGSNSYTLIRESDNNIVGFTTGGTVPFTTTTIDGFTLTISNNPPVGSEYVIRPTINGASDIGVLITDPRKLALSAPLRSSSATNVAGIPTNIGNAVISDVTIDTVSGIPISQPITLTFEAANSRFLVSNPPGGVLLYNPANDNAGVEFTLPSAGNARFTISGFPEDGDGFVIENNLGADGDNSNGLLLAELQSTRTLLDGSATFQEAYAQMIADVGARTRQSEISSEALNLLVEQTRESRDSVSGVNLDEEAANLLRFQQSYSAAAQLINVADELFQTLIATFR